MNMLSEQADRLREKADELRNIHVDDENVGLLFAAIGAMREAADAIESMRDRLQAASETCELEAFADVLFSVDYEIEGYDSGSGRDYATLAECSKCGAYVIVPPAYHHVLICDGDEVYQPYRYCPSCRREVVDA